MSLRLDDLTYRIALDDSGLPEQAGRTAAAMGALNAPTQALGRNMAGVTRESKLTRQEMMALNYTVSDTIASLGSGMSPLTILLQQGPQVRDAFGGIGNALRAIGSLITPAVAGFGALAIAGGTLVTAFVQGYRQSDALEKAINRTGNAAGVTAGQFDAMVTAVAAAGDASEGSSRQILLGLVRTGQVGPQALQAAATAAAAMARAYGQTEDEVVKSFMGMQKGVAAWAAEQNKTMNFLTVEQYRYIKALEDQGKQTEAQLELFKLLGGAADRVTNNLGTLERGWDAIGRAASSAWQAMLNIGREQTVEQRIDELEALRERMMAPGGGYGGADSPAMLQEIARIDMQIAAAREQVAAQRSVAAEQAKAAAANRAAIEAEIKAEEERKRRRAAPRQRQEFASAIDDPALEQQLAFLRSEREGYGETDKFIRERDDRAAQEASKRLESLLSGTTVRKAQALREQLALLNAEWARAGGGDSSSALGQAILNVEQQLRDLEPVGRSAFEQMSVFADQAARNIQDGLGDTIEMALAGNFENIGQMWVRLMQRMVAQAAAARLNEALFGQGGNAGNALLSLFSTAIGAFGGSYNGSSGINGGSTMLPGSLRGGGGYPGFASGGMHRGGLRIVGERGPELEATGPARIFSAEQTQRMLAGAANGGGVVINQTINAAPGTNRAELAAAMQQAKSAAVAEVFDAMRRGRPAGGLA